MNSEQFKILHPIISIGKKVINREIVKVFTLSFISFNLSRHLIGGRLLDFNFLDVESN